MAINTNRLCPKCGVFNQMELQYDDGWQLQCLKCSKITYLKDGEIPQGLNQREFEVANLQSPKDVHYSFSMYGYNSRRTRLTDE